MMVKISPKALRFATAVTMAELSGRTLQGDTAWGAGRTLWDKLVKRYPLSDDELEGRTMVRYITIPNEVGLLLLFAVDKCLSLAAHDQHDETDPDIGNDLMFLLSIKESLERELQND